MPVVPDLKLRRHLQKLLCRANTGIHEAVEIRRFVKLLREDLENTVPPRPGQPETNDAFRNEPRLCNLKQSPSLEILEEGEVVVPEVIEDRPEIRDPVRQPPIQTLQKLPFNEPPIATNSEHKKLEIQQDVGEGETPRI
jgi:hypothetical protein